MCVCVCVCVCMRVCDYILFTHIYTKFYFFLYTKYGRIFMINCVHTNIYVYIHKLTKITHFSMCLFFRIYFLVLLCLFP